MLVYALVKDPAVCHNTITVFRGSGDETGKCAKCSKKLEYTLVDLFSKRLLNIFCSLECIKQYDPDFMNRAPKAMLEPPAEIEIPKFAAPETEKSKTKKSASKKVCPKCGGEAKRGPGNKGQFKHIGNCTG